MVPLGWVILAACASLAHCQTETRCTEGAMHGQGAYWGDPIRICCNGDWVNTERIGKIYETCNVEPNITNLSYEDSMWLQYHCYVSKSLLLEPLNLSSYAAFVSRLPKSRQGYLLSQLPTTPVKNDGDSELERIQAIKSYWNQYVETIKEICFPKNVSADSFVTNVTGGFPGKVVASPELQIGRSCSNGGIPNFLSTTNNMKFMSSRMIAPCRAECEFKINQLVGNISSNILRHNATLFCFQHPWRDLVRLEVEDIPDTIEDYHGIIRKLIPNYWSVSVKRDATENMLSHIKMQYPPKTDSSDFKYIIDNAREIILREMRSVLKGEEIANEKFVVNAILTGSIYRLSQYVQSHGMCNQF
ncbi:unnamed protein product [Allacma fusca]|uniref:Uncharacterized protein n=1 Tax=Allacma fusca TaxID=39272 RepID=A0A8J2LUT6_9HEXA|nr:unnamed protein product [Allacma fusca]